MVTKEIALSLKPGQILHSKSKLNADKTPVRVRVNGKCQTWARRPLDFKLPVKYGLRTYGYIDNFDLGNFHDWEIPQ